MKYFEVEAILRDTVSELEKCDACMTTGSYSCAQRIAALNKAIKVVHKEGSRSESKRQNDWRNI